MTHPLPFDYLPRVYAGVLGKLIGVYLGRPIEGWTYQRIVDELGSVTYYVHNRFGLPLVVTDDDVSGTFGFVRALEEHGVSPDLSAEAVGKTWLNMVIEQRSVFWWGGNGNSTEHTAWLNLKRGIPAPRSGSIAVNGAAVAEQIGAQIFVDGWAMVAPGNPALAAKLAEAAASVSHDGEAVLAAKVLAAMEAEAFRSTDIDHLLDTGLRFIPSDSLIARLIADLRRWRVAYPDWRDTRALVETHYGYDAFPGMCHVVPNHALIILALLYAPDDFSRALSIVNTCGWDTDCNAGNVGCLLGIMLGLDGIVAGPDWRGPLADRALISTADGGYAVNDAARIALDLTNLGRQLAGEAPLPPPKQGAQFHFTLPGSVQGFMARPDLAGAEALVLTQEDHGGVGVLQACFRGLAPGRHATISTPTFAPPEVVHMRSYDLQATPRLSPGQILHAHVLADGANAGSVTVCLRLTHYGRDDALVNVDGPPVEVAPGSETSLRWTVPDLDGQPIGAVGLALSSPGGSRDGAVRVDFLRWDGAPNVSLHRPTQSSDFWRRAWVNGVSLFSRQFPAAFRLSQDHGEGILIHGTRQWTDLMVSSRVTVNLGQGGLAIRVQGLRRYYALILDTGDRVRLVRVRDDERTILAEAACAWRLDSPVPLELHAAGSRLTGFANGIKLVDIDDRHPRAFRNGGIGLVVAEGALSTDEVRVGPIAGAGPTSDPL